MSRSNKAFISVGIDVGADISWMSIALPNQLIVGKPFKITHSNLLSLEKAVQTIKEAEEKYSLESHIFLESTGIYHYPLFCYLRDRDLNCYVINPIISKNSTNINIRKVHNDKFDSKKIALIGLKPDLKTSVIPSDLALDLRNLVREYYYLSDERSAYVNKLKGQLRMAFPQYINVFSKITTQTSLKLLDIYTSPQAFLDADKEELIQLIQKTSRFGLTYATNKYDTLMEAATAALSFGYALSSNFALIRRYISSIRRYDEDLTSLLAAMNELANDNEDEMFVKQLRIIESIKGAGFLTAATLMCEIGDFSAFAKPKQLFAYFGLDPDVKQSGHFMGSNAKMSKRGSALARRAIHTIAIINIGKSKNGIPHNPVLLDYYQAKCNSKPKKVALGAVMHKVCNIVFAILRDHKEFAIISPHEHNLTFQHKVNSVS